MAPAAISNAANAPNKIALCGARNGKRAFSGRSDLARGRSVTSGIETDPIAGQSRSCDPVVVCVERRWCSGPIWRYRVAFLTFADQIFGGSAHGALERNPGP